MSGEPKRHHFVPLMYLAGFTDDAGSIYVYDKTSGRFYSTGPRSIATEKDGYRVSDESVDPYVVEKMFSRMEADAAPVFRELRATGVMPEGENYHTLVSFIAFQIVRVIGFRESLQDSLERADKRQLRMQLASEAVWRKAVAFLRSEGVALGPEADDYDSLKAFVEGDEYSIHVDRGWLIGSMLEAAVKIDPLIAAREWVVVRAPSHGQQFITSDRPVTLGWRPGFERAFPPGLGIATTELCLPIAPDMAIAGLPPGEEPLVSSAEAVVSRLNSRTALHATRLLFAARSTHLPSAMAGLKSGVREETQ